MSDDAPTWLEAQNDELEDAKRAGDSARIAEIGARIATHIRKIRAMNGATE